MSAGTGPRLESRALAKGLELIAGLSLAKTPLSLSNLSAMIGLGKPSTLRLLSTLVATGFVAKDAAGNYEATRRLIEPAAGNWLTALIDAARVEMETLNADLAETVSLAALFEDHIRVVFRLESPRHIRLSNYLNRILPPYASSLGKAITAYQTPEKLQSLLQVYGSYRTTEKSITEPVQIREDMARAGTWFLVRVCEETVIGGCCFGAPIPVPGEPVRAALSVSLPTSRLTEALENTIPTLLVRSVRRVARKLDPRRAKGLP
ncbi:MAG: IclR family transcriptional regulator [Acidobacteria bacterium]|nr:IclR family transcriptional regulator [Acidobacteriota bacterium]